MTPRIRLTRKPKNLGAGVRVWTFYVSSRLTLRVFERTPEHGRPYLLRVDRVGGEVLETRYAQFQGQAEDKAAWMYERILDGELS